MLLAVSIFMIFKLNMSIDIYLDFQNVIQDHVTLYSTKSCPK